MSTNSKGTYYEKKSMDILEKRGYRVERALPKVIWVKGRPLSIHHDFFGLFDLIAVRPDGMLFVQVKYYGENTHARGKEDVKGALEFPAPVHSKLMHLWRKQGNKAVLEELEICTLDSSSRTQLDGSAPRLFD